jgi:hypothetical protein
MTTVIEQESHRYAVTMNALARSQRFQREVWGFGDTVVVLGAEVMLNSAGRVLRVQASSITFSKYLINGVIALLGVKSPRKPEPGGSREFLQTESLHEEIQIQRSADTTSP